MIFVGDGGPAVPDPLPALHPEDVPESSRLHLLWSPAVEIVPGDAVKDLQVLGAQANFVMLPTVWDLVNKLFTPFLSFLLSSKKFWISM